MIDDCLLQPSEVVLADKRRLFLLLFSGSWINYYQMNSIDL